jgi:hypothetical protein
MTVERIIDVVERRVIFLRACGTNIDSFDGSGDDVLISNLELLSDLQSTEISLLMRNIETYKSKIEVLEAKILDMEFAHQESIKKIQDDFQIHFHHSNYTGE